MTANKHKGEVALDLDGKEHILVFDWNAIAKLQAELGPDFDQKVVGASIKCDLDTLAKVLSIGLARHNPVTAEQIKELSPPIIAVSTAVNEALTAAFYGTEVPAKADENPPGNDQQTSLQKDGGQPSQPA